MNIKQLALVLGAASLVAASGMGAVACSSSSSGSKGTGSSSGGSGSSSGGTMDSSAGDTGTTEEAGESDAGMGGADCGKIPYLHDAAAGSIFCGYPPGDGGSAIECASTSGEGGASFCCLGGKEGTGYAPQICSPTAAGCIADGEPDAGYGGLPIQCNQLGDCPGNGAPGATACCLQGANLMDMMASCGYDKASSGTGIVCEGTGGGAATACTAGEIQVCVSNADCPMGTTCKAGKWKVFQMGFCLP